MKFSINLRGDLAKLTDAELSERLKSAIADFDEANNRGLLSGSSPWWHWRGPIRHPRAYRAFSSFFAGSNGSFFLDLVWVLTLSGKTGERLLRRDRATAMHLSLCEIEDLMDEAKRRGFNVRGMDQSQG
jgi:hypothetical protein